MKRKEEAKIHPLHFSVEDEGFIDAFSWTFFSVSTTNMCQILISETQV